MVSRFHNSEKHTKCPSGWSVLQTLGEFELMRQGGLSAVHAGMFGGAWESGHRRQSDARACLDGHFLQKDKGQGSALSIDDV